MKEYKKVVQSYETNEISKCICDRCGKECDISDKQDQKRTQVQISPQYIVDKRLYRDLCPECTRKLLAWFKQDEDVKDFIETLDICESIK